MLSVESARRSRHKGDPEPEDLDAPYVPIQELPTQRSAAVEAPISRHFGRSWSRCSPCCALQGRSNLSYALDL